MATAKHFYIKIRIPHVLLYTFLDRSYKFPVQSISTINRKILFFLFDTIINLTEQSTIRQ